MRKTISLLIAILIIAILISSGCSGVQKQTGTSSAGSARKTITPTPSSKLTTGSIQVSSNPTGADIYLDGVYVGKTIKLLENVNAGTHQIVLNLDGYTAVSGTVEVIAGQTATFSKTLTALKPEITVNILSTQQSLNKYTITGNVTNTGGIDAFRTNLTFTLTPITSGYQKREKNYYVGMLTSGSTKTFVVEIDINSAIDYRLAIKWECQDENDKKYTGSVKI